MAETLTSLLSTLTASLVTAANTDFKDVQIPVEKGISLLDLKNELFLSYVQNLAFLILLRIRHAKEAAEQDVSDLSELNEEATKKLAELRLYIEKGVRPLEQRLKYEIDKVVRAANEATTSAATKTTKGINGTKDKTSNGDAGSSDESGEGSGDDSDSSIDEMAYRPNISALATQTKGAATKDRKSSSRSDGIYRPPRINPTAMPTTTSREERAARRPQKSHTMDEFIATEFSTAPVAEPSIGSTIREGGRRNQSARERADDAERRVYEETNFVRLPAESKKDRAKKGGRERNSGFGGEEWRDLGQGLDRIENLTRKKSGGASGKLASSRKRGWDTQDGPRGSGGGADFGGDFAKRQRKVMRKFR